MAAVVILVPVASWATTGTPAQDEETYLPPANLRALPKAPDSQQKTNAQAPVQRRQAQAQPTRRYIYAQPRRPHFEPFFFGLFQ